MSIPDPSSQPDLVATVADDSLEPAHELLTEHELEHLLAIAEEKDKARRRRDKINAIVVTIALHALVIFGFSFIVLSQPRPQAPAIVANASLDAPQETIDMETLEKPTPQPTDPVQMALPDIVTVEGASSFSVLSSDAVLSTTGFDMPTDFAPSMAFGAPTDAAPMTLFGQKMETEKLGVILDVSGSMAEFLPDVIREVDKNFRNAPIVYVTNALIQKSGSATQLIEILPSEVMPYYDEGTRDRRHTPYWFLWGDLPRKAPQRYVDRLIQIFKTRKNSYLTYGGHNRVGKAVEYLLTTDIEALYILSDFADFIDEGLITEIGQDLSRKKIKTFPQPAVEVTANLSTVDRFLAKRTLGRTMPPLVELLGPPKEEEKRTIMVAKKPELPDSSFVEYATPREELNTPKNIWNRSRSDWQEISRLETKEFTAVFFGPEARADIYVKDKNGKYIQHPIIFSYHSNKFIDDGRVNPWRWRHWVRNQEPPQWDGKSLVWKMILEDELKFDVYLYMNDRGMNATYTAEPPKDGKGDSAYIYFRFPPLASARNDRFYGYDFPKDGLELEDIRKCVKPNTATFNLPNQHRDRYGKEWAARGFEPGYNKRGYDEMIRVLPDGIRDVVVEGPSFGSRKFHARTTSNKILLSGGSHRSDFEMWEGFFCRLIRTTDVRTRFTKTEAIMVEIE